MGRVVRARDRGEPQPHLLQLVTYLPHSRQLSSLGSLHPADRFDPVSVQRSKVGRRGKAAGDPLRFLLRRHCHRRRLLCGGRSDFRHEKSEGLLCGLI